MASLPILLAAAEGGLAGSAVRGAVEGSVEGSVGGTVGSVAQGAATAVAEPAAALGQSSFSWGSYIQAVGILFLLVAVLWLAVWLARRFGKFNFMPRPGALPRDALVMEAQLPLGPRKGLMVVRFLNKRLLLGVTDQQITLLTEEQAKHEPENGDFQQVMEQARRGAGDS